MLLANLASRLSLAFDSRCLVGLVPASVPIGKLGFDVSGLSPWQTVSESGKFRVRCSVFTSLNVALLKDRILLCWGLVKDAVFIRIGMMICLNLD